MQLAQLTVFGQSMGDLAVGFIFVIGILGLILLTGYLFYKGVTAMANKIPGLNQKELRRMAKEEANSELNTRFKELDRKTKKYNDAATNLASVRKDKEIKNNVFQT